MEDDIIKHLLVSIKNSGLMVSAMLPESLMACDVNIDRAALLYDIDYHEHVEIIHVLSGELMFFVQDNWFAFQENQNLAVLPGCLHAEYYSRIDQPYELLWCTALPKATIFHITAYEPGKGFSVSNKRHVIDSPFDELLWELTQKKDFGGNEIAQCQFVYLLMEFLCNYLSINKDNNLTTDEYHDKIINQAKLYIERYYWEGLSLDKLARILRYSPGHLNTLFKQKVGCPIHHYILDIRMQKAKELLESGTVLVKQAAEKVGFKDQLYFSKKFKAKYGFSPSEI